MTKIFVRYSNGITTPGGVYPLAENLNLRINPKLRFESDVIHEYGKTHYLSLMLLFRFESDVIHELKIPMCYSEG